MKRTTIRSQCYYPEPPLRVWRALTDPAELAGWLASVEFKPRRGHRFRWKEAGPLDGAVCEVHEVEEPRRLSYRLEHAGGSSVVTWTLEPVGDGTRVIVEQELVADAELRLHPSVVSLAQYRRRRSLLRLQAELDVELRRRGLGAQQFAKEVA